MKWKHKTYKTTYYDMNSKTWKEYEIVSPEMERDYSGLINTGKAFVEGTKALSLFTLASFLIGHVMGVF